MSEQRYARENSASVGTRPCGVYLSTASGSSRQSLVISSPRDRPVCLDKVSNTSGPIARSSWSAVHGWLGPVLTQDFAVSLWPLEALHKFVEPTTEDPAGVSAAEAELGKQATNAALRLCSGFILPASTEHFGDLVPISRTG